MDWLRGAWRIYRQTQQRRTQARILPELDARTLKDIGLEVHADERRRRGAMRLTALRMGIGLF